MLTPELERIADEIDAYEGRHAGKFFRLLCRVAEADQETALEECGRKAVEEYNRWSGPFVN